jgi:hypothetical protein
LLWNDLLAICETWCRWDLMHVTLY